VRLTHPAYPVTVRHNGRVLEMVGGKDFLLCPLGMAPSLIPDRLPHRLEDLVRLAAGVYVADTVCRRFRRGEEGGWSRRIDLGVEVSEPDFWNSQPVQTTLKNCLDFLGGDDWNVRFLRERSARPWGVQEVIPFVTRPTVCLFSDGLDSAAGLAARLAGNPDEAFVALSVRHRSGLAVRTSGQITRLRSVYGRDNENLLHVVLGTLVRQRKPAAAGFRRPERSHRCRAFVFAALGGVVARMTGAERVEVYESGVGAVNLPLRKGMTGSLTTRGSHPRFLRLMGELLEHVTERRITYDLPFLDRTKAEMVGFLAGDERLRELARSTASCVHYPLGRKVGKQCGACPACVFRRQAMCVAGIVEPVGTYAYDLFGDAESALGVPEGHRRWLRGFLQQVAWLRPLDRPGGMPPRLRGHLFDTEVVLERDADLSLYADLFRCYRREWLKLAAEARGRGLWWGGMLSRAVAA
jgi:hypothetical protein